MSDPRDAALAALRRLLANGPLTGVPKRPADQRLVAELAAARFEAGRDYAEGEVNERLEGWLAAISAPFGLDHVTLRRMLVDARLLLRTRSGSSYRQNPDKRATLVPLGGIDPARLLDELRKDRERRKEAAGSRSRPRSSQAPP